MAKVVAKARLVDNDRSRRTEASCPVLRIFEEQVPAESELERVCNRTVASEKCSKLLFSFCEGLNC